MVELVNFTTEEQDLVTGLMAQFRQDSFRMCELTRVERTNLPGYNGKVEPVRLGERLDMTMYLACTNPFTIAHELAHVSDISVRRQETFDNLSLDMPAGWHLAHRMSSEYYANRIACEYSHESDIFAAFLNDQGGLRIGAHQGDWASAMIHYALLLGIFHGMDRTDCDPLKLLPKMEIPEIVLSGLDGFRGEAEAFFAGYHGQPVALAA